MALHRPLAGGEETGARLILLRAYFLIGHRSIRIRTLDAALQDIGGSSLKDSGGEVLSFRTILDDATR